MPAQQSGYRLVLVPSPASHISMHISHQPVAATASSATKVRNQRGPTAARNANVRRTVEQTVQSSERTNKHTNNRANQPNDNQTVNNKRRTTNNKRRTTLRQADIDRNTTTQRHNDATTQRQNDERQTNGKRQTTNGKRQTTNDERRTTNNERRNGSRNAPLTHSPTVTHSLPLTHSHSLTVIHSQSVSQSVTHSLTHSLSLTVEMTLFYSGICGTHLNWYFLSYWQYYKIAIYALRFSFYAGPCVEFGYGNIQLFIVPRKPSTEVRLHCKWFKNQRGTTIHNIVLF